MSDVADRNSDVESDSSPQKADSSSPIQVKTLTDAQKARIERNRQKALLLKQSRIASRPYSLDKADRQKAKLPSQPIDTGAGFFLEEEELSVTQRKVVHPEPQGPVLREDCLLCEECGKDFHKSYLYDTFEVPVCDACRDAEEKHKLITKSEAKETYLLKDADFDRREPPLKFIVKKNPRNQNWGDMKLYLESQVHARAMDVWGSEEKIEDRREELSANREKAKQKRFDKKVKDLRNAVRSSLWKKDLGPHEHVYGEETYNDKEDIYSKTCTTCGHVMSYEKM